jgi:hypothetical protein
MRSLWVPSFAACRQAAKEGTHPATRNAPEAIATIPGQIAKLCEISLEQARGASDQIQLMCNLWRVIGYLEALETIYDHM